MSGFEITCVNKDIHGAIIRIGGQGWSLPIREAIVKVVGRQLRLMLFLDNAYLEVGVRGEGLEAYLALEPNGNRLDEIPDLPSCEY